MGEELKDRTEEELKQIARDLFHGKILTTRHQALIDNPGDISHVFMPLLFLAPELRERFQKQSPAMIFEYLEKAGPRTLNGMPMFMSMQWLDKEEDEKVMEYYRKLKEAEKTAQGSV